MHTIDMDTWSSEWKGPLTKIGFAELPSLAIPLPDQSEQELLQAYTQVGNVYAEFSVQPAYANIACQTFLTIWTIDERSNRMVVYDDSCGLTTSDPKGDMVESINCVLADALEDTPEITALLPSLKELRGRLTR